jgi:mRNA interferase MazF
MIVRGEIFWADLGDPDGSMPAERRTVLIIQANPFNASNSSAVTVAVVTSNLKLATVPGNVLVPADMSGLDRDSVVNVTAIATINRLDLEIDPAGEVPPALMGQVDRGLRMALGL